MAIAKVCKKFDTMTNMLRYYERIGLIPNVGRTAKDIRNYTDLNEAKNKFTKIGTERGHQD